MASGQEAKRKVADSVHQAGDLLNRHGCLPEASHQHDHGPQRRDFQRSALEGRAGRFWLLGPQAPNKNGNNDNNGDNKPDDAKFQVPLSELVSSAQREKDVDGELPQWREFHEEIFEKWVKLILTDSSSATLTEELKGRQFCSLATQCLCSIARLQSPADQTASVPPKRVDEMDPCLRSRRRSELGACGGGLPPKHLVAVFDGGKRGNFHESCGWQADFQGDAALHSADYSEVHGRAQGASGASCNRQKCWSCQVTAWRLRTSRVCI